MTEHRQVPEPGEMVYASNPSWAPAFLALGAVGLVGGIFAAGFFPTIVYAVVGAILVLGTFRSMIRGAIRDYYRRPRRQERRGAALPVETISGPPKP